MPRRKQDCPKRMKWEGGEDGSPEDGDKLEGEEDAGSITSASPTPPDEDAASPTPGDLPSPTSPRSLEDTTNCRAISRCQSRDSSPGPPRCPSGESLLSEGASMLRGLPAALSPVGVALPATIPAAAAAALLPPQSAAMAAYLNAAAAAAVAQQSHRLMMTSPLRSSVSPLVTSSSSPPNRLLNHSPNSPLDSNAILDFSKKSHGDSDAVNLSSSKSPRPETGSAPLDLSVNSRKRSAPIEEPPSTPHRKQRTLTPQWNTPLNTSQLPYFAAAVAAANLSPKSASAELWNGKLKQPNPTPNDATKALEKMSELSKLGGEDLFRSMAASAAVAAAAASTPASNRHSAWQSHWLNKGAEQAKDVLKCVWCKQSFPSLAAMTTHMKEAKHCGVNVPVPQIPPPNLTPQPPITSPSNTNTSTSSTNSSKPNQDLNMLIKETMPLPRKLVRGQDVWLGKGAEQTRQILKCMWCGQSFRSLAEMTSHMQQTQHYTNIISQEQIISWRSTDDSKGTQSTTSNSERVERSSTSGGNATPTSAASSHVSAVLTCKVCDQAFSSLKELSNHMVKNSHYKEHIMRSITESGGRRRQTREKRKKSLPVRKLLELERAQHDFKNGDNGSSIIEKMRDAGVAGRITCEKCGNKIETALFVDHIRQCVGGMTTNQRNFLKSALMSNIIPPETTKTTPQKSTTTEKSPSPVSSNDKEPAPTSEPNNGSSPSVLNAIEKLIEKSFDSRTRQGGQSFPGHGATQAPIGSSILKRLGIDESVDYTKPLVDAHTMNLLRTYHQQTHYAGSRRERSGSESSSISERGSTSLTPERKMEPPNYPITSTPRTTPDIKREKSPVIDKNHLTEPAEGEVKIKKEPEEEEVVVVKKERLEDEEDESKVEEDKAEVSSPCRTSAASPASSERSGTPRSTNGTERKASTPGGSLGALSTMFDNLSGTASSEPSTTSTKRSSSHPLAALQKLCDKTETRGAQAPSSTSTPATSTTATTTTSTPAGAILAFSWACNDAVMTSDSIMKCAFCDTPFISKGAYRHHLSKMHFVKDGVIPDGKTSAGAASAAASASSTPGVPLKSTTNTRNNEPAPPSTSKSPPSTTPATAPPPPPPTNTPGFEESPHSKFLKYTELAKQLSSKYV